MTNFGFQGKLYSIQQIAEKVDAEGAPIPDEAGLNVHERD